MIEITDVQNKLVEFLRGGVFSAQIQVDENTDLIASGFDSMSLVSLLVFIEKTYGIWIPQGEITEANLQNPGTLAAAVVRLLNEQPPKP
ncbi:MAG: acyl carrier protein [Ginsengibacter sp.]